METALGVLAVGLSGLIIGSSVWPFKLVRKYQFEHWWFVSMFFALFVLPWGITLLACEDPINGLRAVPTSALIKANLLSLAWGIANVLSGLCYARIGVALTGAVLTGLGVCVGTTLPMVLKGSGQFQDAPDLTSTSGMTLMVGLGVMLIGVVLATLAGIGRDRQLKKMATDAKQPPRTKGRVVVGLAMAALAGVLSAGLAMSFVYSQGPVMANVSTVHPGSRIAVDVPGHTDLSREYDVDAKGNIEMPGASVIQVGRLKAAAAAMRIQERLAAGGLAIASNVSVHTGSIPAVFAVFAVGIIGGLLVNLGFAVVLLTRNKSWHVFAQSPRDFLLAATIAANLVVGIGLQSKGMLWLGALGATVGFGIQQAMQMTGGQGLGFISGEWRGVRGTPRTQMYLAIAVLFIAAGIMVIGKKLGATG